MQECITEVYYIVDEIVKNKMIKSVQLGHKSKLFASEVITFWLRGVSVDLAR